MNIHFLGTSSGVPSKTRNTASIGVTFERTKSWLMVDCGEATQQQLLKSDLSFFHIETICISHVHGDHCYGLPGLLSTMSMNGKKSALNLIAPKSVIEWINMTLKMSHTQLSFDLLTHDIESINKQIEFESYDIELITLKHRVPSYGFKFTEKLIPNKLNIDKLRNEGITSGPHFNLLQKGEDVIFQGKTLLSKEYTYPSWTARRVIICGDNEKPALLQSYCNNIDLLVHEATFTHSDLYQVGFHTGHSDAKRVAEFAQINAIPSLALTHFSVRYHGPHGLAKIKNEAEMSYKGNLILADDFQVFNIAKKEMR